MGSILAHNAENSEEYYFNWQDKKGAEEKKKRGKRWIVAVCSEEIERKRNCISHFQPQKYKAASQQKRRRRRRKRRCLKLPRDKRKRGKKMEDWRWESYTRAIEEHLEADLGLFFCLLSRRKNVPGSSRLKIPLSSIYITRTCCIVYIRGANSSPAIHTLTSWWTIIRLTQPQGIFPFFFLSLSLFPDAT